MKSFGRRVQNANLVVDPRRGLGAKSKPDDIRGVVSFRSFRSLGVWWERHVSNKGNHHSHPHTPPVSPHTFPPIFDPDGICEGAQMFSRPVYYSILLAPPAVVAHLLDRAHDSAAGRQATPGPWEGDASRRAAVLVPLVWLLHAADAALCRAGGAGGFEP